MFINSKLLRDDIFDETAREMYKEGTIDMDQAIALTIAASLHKIATYGLDISYNEHSETTVPVVIQAFEANGDPAEPVKVHVVRVPD